MSKNNTKSDSSFKDQIKEFEEIVEWFESEEVDLDQAVEKFEKGMKLADALKGQLEEIENTVEEIKLQYESNDKK